MKSSRLGVSSTAGRGGGRWGVLMVVGVDVREDAMDGNVPQSLLEEEELHRAGPDQTEARQEKKKPAETGQLPRITKRQRHRFISFPTLDSSRV